MKEEMLKHAAEEFRHAHYLKRQIKKITTSTFENYAVANLLGGFASLHYLDALDLSVSRFLLKTLKLPKSQVKEVSYLLVTYAIEVRAQVLYPIYHEILRNLESPVHVKSIILEEEEHLNEMEVGLKELPWGFDCAEKICKMEESLYASWLKGVKRDILRF